MDSQENEQPVNQHQQPNHNNQPLSLTSKLKPFAFFFVPILILSLAIFFSIANTNLFKTHLLKHTFSSNSNFLRTFLTTFSPKHQNIETHKPTYCLLWMSPFLSGGGYSSEGWSYILALHQHIKNPTFKLAIKHHGDLESLEFWEGLPGNVQSLAIKLHGSECGRMNETIVICHSEPGAWNPPKFETFPCPPSVYRNYKAVIGRTMFETDRVNVEHVKRCNKMDFVWVPTEFHVSTFVDSGVDPSKVVKIVQPIDAKFFNPGLYKPLELDSVGSLVLGEEKIRKSNPRFVFLSVFKWEYRKGWDILLRSYLEEFTGVDDVALFLLTNPYHSDRDFGNKIVEFVENSGLVAKPVTGFAPIYVIDHHIAQTDLPRLYKAVDAFVLPSRGEGWGRPIVEAMAMSLPVIATNWSGPTEYMTEENSYPLTVDRMSEVTDGPFRGHFWAEPSVGKLRVLMRQVRDNVEEAKGRGKEARADMIRRFSPEIVARIVADKIQDIIENSNE